MSNTAYLHHRAGDAGPFHTVLVHLRRAPAGTDGTRYAGHIRSALQYREHGKRGWCVVWRDEMAPAWASWKAPQHYALIDGKRCAISV